MKHTILTAAALVAALALPAAAQQRVSIGTGGTGGLFYVIGAGMSDLITEHMPDTTARAEVTGASIENIRRTTAGELEMGFYEEGELNLALVIQEHLALQLPQQVTCDLSGVTPAEGVSPCTPDLLKPPERGPDPRWAALAALKLGADSEN